MAIDIGSYEGQNRNRISSHGIMYLRNILKSPNTLLSHLYLAGNYIGNSGLNLLKDGLIGNLKVLDLDISNNEIRGKEGA